jgi:hypothetical protein
MAEWHPIHKPLNFRSGLETGGQSYDPPLLPYEIALIEALGCSEEEYKEFVRHARDSVQVRPAAYAGIPDIQNGPVVPILINLAIGLALTAVSILLAPKAPALETPAKIRGKKLADQIGPTRFNQTTSFDNVNSLAEYGQPIPIPFGKRGTGRDGALTGGLIVAPALVWSRLYSNGAYQTFEGIYVAGQYGLSFPELAGIRVGTNALSSLGERDYSFFWSSVELDNRPAEQNRIFGLEGSNRQMFTAPSSDGQYSQGFSMAYNPNGDLAFGTSSPIHNGSAYRFNWEVISGPYQGTFGPDFKQERMDIKAQRRKIAGSLADVIHDEGPARGMPGVGRAYSRRMGFIAHNNTEYSTRTVVDVAPNDTLTFEINGQSWQALEQRASDNGGFKGTEVNLKDLKSSANSWRARASDLLSVGSKWIIGSSIWVVESRSPELWKRGVTQQIVFKCVGITGVATVGIAGTKTVRNELGLGGYEGQAFDPEVHCGAAFFNVCRLHMASVRPVRRDAEVIELGIRSQVWNKVNGLCNFNAIPSAQKLHRMDKKNITLNTPRIDKYFTRTSCFSVWVRPVPEYGQTLQPWERIPEVFCVSGDSPIDLYNYLRIRPRTIDTYYEYRIIPRTGSDIAVNSLGTNDAVRLNAQSGQEIGKDYETPYGTFRLTTHGDIVLIEDIKINEELTTDPSEFQDGVGGVGIPDNIEQVSTTANNKSIYLVNQAWYTEVLGYALDYEDEKREVQFEAEVNNKKLTIAVKAVSAKGKVGTTLSQKYVDVTGSRYRWDDVVFTVIDAQGSWNVGDTFSITKNTSRSTNVFAKEYNYTKVTMEFKVSNVQVVTTGGGRGLNAERIFEQNSQISDCSHYLEFVKSNESGPEHTIVYINEYVANENLAQYYGMSTAALSVKSSGQIKSIGQLRAWTPAGISVKRLIEEDLQDYGPSNLFSDLVYYLLTSNSQGVGNVVPEELIDTDSLVTTAKYLRNNKIFYDGVIEDSENLRSFLYDNAALQLCNFTIKNGRFGMMPALPYDSNYVISTQPINVEQIFTSGNIIQDSLQVQYIDAAQRSNFRALVSWRITVQNDLPTQASALVDWADIPEGSRSTTQQTFDLTEFCTNRAQALLTARFLLSIRRRVTHTVSFKTVPDALGIEPGSYIRVITESTSYSATNNGGITDAGTLVSIKTIEDGTYDAIVYNPATGKVTEQRISISGNAVTDSSLYGCLFTLVSIEAGMGVYQVEQLTLDEDGLVNISAVEVPVDASGASIVAKDVLDETAFRVLE